MRVTQWGEFGIHFATYLARQADEGRPTVGAAEIARSQGVDLQYTQQILQRLRRGGIIESVRGPSGGYRLKASPASITLFDIISATEGHTFESAQGARSTERPHPNAAPGLERVWSDFKLYIDSYLRSCSLADLLRASVEAYANGAKVSDSQPVMAS